MNIRGKQNEEKGLTGTATVLIGVTAILTILVLVSIIIFVVSSVKTLKTLKKEEIEKGGNLVYSAVK